MNAAAAAAASRQNIAARYDETGSCMMWNSERGEIYKSEPFDNVCDTLWRRVHEDWKEQLLQMDDWEPVHDGWLDRLLGRICAFFGRATC